MEKHRRKPETRGDATRPGHRDRKKVQARNGENVPDRKEDLPVLLSRLYKTETVTSLNPKDKDERFRRGPVLAALTSAPEDRRHVHTTFVRESHLWPGSHLCTRATEDTS